MAETFVLVHGGWHGAWCWAAVLNELDRRGDRGYPVDLPGNAANPYDRSKVTLALYVDNVVRFIEDRDLRNVVLAGHSMAGVILPGVVTKIARRIKRAVFVAALVAEDGKPVFSPEEELFKPFVELANSRYDRSFPIEPLAERFRHFFMQDASREMQDYVLACLCPQPVQPFFEPVAMKDFHATAVPQSYLLCTDDLAPDGHPKWTTYMGRLRAPLVRKVKSGHEVMITAPQQCAEALYEFARS